MSSRFPAILVCLLLFGINYGFCQTIGSISPASGAAGSTITIAGSNFGDTQGTGRVTFGPLAATISTWNDSSITVTAPSRASTGNVVVKAASGVSSNGVLFTIFPTASDISPNSAAVGSLVTISGSSFGGSSGTVSFNGVNAPYVASWNPTSIIAPVPAGATSGNVIITSSGRTPSNALSFAVVPQPNITSLSPTAGFVNSTVIISGANFGAMQGWGSVTLNGLFATISSWSDTSIIADVPVGATSGNVIVTAWGGIASNALNFQIVQPVISSLNPAAGRSGITVTISGSNFGVAQNGGTVTFNGLPTQVNSWSDRSISATVPPGIHTGPVVVTTEGESSNGVRFTFAPGIRTQAQPLYITPDEISLEVGRSGAFKVVDPSGNAVLDATWTVDSAALATIAADDPTLPTATLQALAPGEITITATSSLGTVQAKGTIFGAGLTPPGTGVWTLYPQTQDGGFWNTVKGLPSTRNEPYMYFTEFEGNVAQVTALAANGQSKWKRILNSTAGNDSIFPITASGTNDGGLLMMTGESGFNSNFNTFRRFGTDGTPLWTYTTPTDVTFDPAIGPDGTIYFWSNGDQSNNNDTPLIALDDATGTEKFRFHSTGGSLVVSSSEQPGTVNPDGTTVTPNNPWRPCADFFPPGQFSPPIPAGEGEDSIQPIIGTDGAAYVMETIANIGWIYSKCTLSRIGTDPTTGDPLYIVTSMSGQLSYSKSLLLTRLLPDGTRSATQIDTISFSGQAGLEPGSFNGWTFNNGTSKLPNIFFDQTVPDGQGGMLMTWGKVTSDLTDSGHNFLSRLVNGSVASSVPIQLSGHIATNGQNTVFFYNFNFARSVTAVDVTSGAPKWSVTGALIAATSDGGLLIENSDFAVQHIDANGGPGSEVLPTWDTPDYMEPGDFLQDFDFGAKQLLVSNNSSALTQALPIAWPILFTGNALATSAPAWPDMELVWLDKKDAVDIPVQFIFYSNFPQLASDNPQDVTALSPTLIGIMEDTALAALKHAFRTFPVHVGEGHKGTHTAYVVGTNLHFCGGTNQFSAAVSDVYYRNNLEVAQTTLQIGTLTQFLVQSLGEGIGNNAAHEIGHQILASPPMDTSELGTYNGGTCPDIAVFTGRSADGIDIHWSPAAAAALDGILNPHD